VKPRETDGDTLARTRVVKRAVPRAHGARPSKPQRLPAVPLFEALEPTTAVDATEPTTAHTVVELRKQIAPRTVTAFLQPTALRTMIEKMERPVPRAVLEAQERTVPRAAFERMEPTAPNTVGEAPTRPVPRAVLQAQSPTAPNTVGEAPTRPVPRAAFEMMERTVPRAAFEMQERTVLRTVGEAPTRAVLEAQSPTALRTIGEAQTLAVPRAAFEMMEPTVPRAAFEMQGRTVPRAAFEMQERTVLRAAFEMQGRTVLRTVGEAPTRPVPRTALEVQEPTVIWTHGNTPAPARAQHPAPPRSRGSSLALVRSPAPERRAGSASEVARTPAPERRSGSASEVVHNPAPERRAGSAAEVVHNPALEHRAGSAAEIARSPAPGRRAGSAAEVARTPAPVVRSGSASEVARSPAPEVARTPAPERRGGSSFEVTRSLAPERRRGSAAEIARTLAPEVARSPALERRAGSAAEAMPSPAPERGSGSSPELARSPAPALAAPAAFAPRPAPVVRPPPVPGRGSAPAHAMGSGPAALVITPEIEREVFQVAHWIAMQADLSAATRALQQGMSQLTDSPDAMCVLFDPAQGSAWAVPDGNAPRKIDHRAQQLIAQVAVSGQRALLGRALIEPVGPAPARAVLVIRRSPASPAYGAHEVVTLAAIAAAVVGIVGHFAAAHAARCAPEPGEVASPVGREALAERRDGAAAGRLIAAPRTWMRWAYPTLICLVAAVLAATALIQVPTYSTGVSIIMTDGESVTAPVAGTVADVLVAPGAHVAPGDPVVRLQALDEEAELAATEADHRNALARLLTNPGDAAARNTLSGTATRRQRARAVIEARTLRASTAGVVGDIRVGPGQVLVSGAQVMTLSASAGPSVVALLPGFDRPRLAVGMAMQIELPRHKKRELAVIDAIDAQVIGPDEARHSFGDPVGDALPITGSVVVVRAHLAARAFGAGGREYELRDGLLGKAEVRVDHESLFRRLVPRRGE